MAFVVFDTNTLVSAAIDRRGVAGRALQRPWRHYDVATTPETLAEAESVLARPALARFVAPRARARLVDALRRWTVRFAIGGQGPPTRDPTDDRFLHLAIAIEAAFVVTGDADLLALDRAFGLRIVTPREFLRGERMARRGRRPGTRPRPALPRARGIR